MADDPMYHDGMLLLDFEQKKRLRVNGTAQINEQDPLRAEYPDSVFIVRGNLSLTGVRPGRA